MIENETKFEIKKAKYFAGHSLGEYSALCCAEAISFEQTINLLKHRGNAMQNAVPNGEGGMMAVLGKSVEEITKILNENSKNFSCFIANDNTNGQLVISGKLNNLKMLSNELNLNNIKYVYLPVSAPFHCPLMKVATNTMEQIIIDTEFKDPFVEIISNVTASPTNNSKDIKNLLIQQIEKPVRWRESINKMISSGVNSFIEIGPGKVLSGLVKRIDRNMKLNQVNNLAEANKLIND